MRKQDLTDISNMMYTNLAAAEGENHKDTWDAATTRLIQILTIDATLCVSKDPVTLMVLYRLARRMEESTVRANCRLSPNLLAGYGKKVAANHNATISAILTLLEFQASSTAKSSTAKSSTGK